MRRAKGPRLVVMSQIQPPGGAISIVSVEIVFPFKKKLISLSVNAVNPQRSKVTNMAEALTKRAEIMIRKLNLHATLSHSIRCNNNNN